MPMAMPVTVELPCGGHELRRRRGCLMLDLRELPPPVLAEAQQRVPAAATKAREQRDGGDGGAAGAGGCGWHITVATPEDLRSVLPAKQDADGGQRQAWEALLTDAVAALCQGARVAVGETVMLLHSVSSFSRRFNRDGVPEGCQQFDSLADSRRVLAPRQWSCTGSAPRIHGRQG